MHKQSAVFTLVAALLLSACSDNDGPRTPVEPGFTTQSANAPFLPSVGIGSSSLSTHLAGFVRCPDDPPFVTPFNLTVGATESAVFLDAVRLQFFDVVGIPMPDVTLPLPSLTTRFGSTAVSAFSTRTFPFEFRFGCGTSRKGTLIIIVNVRDPRGNVQTTELKATVQ